MYGVQRHHQVRIHEEKGISRSCIDKEASLKMLYPEIESEIASCLSDNENFTATDMRIQTLVIDFMVPRRTFHLP